MLSRLALSLTRRSECGRDGPGSPSPSCWTSDDDGGRGKNRGDRSGREPRYRQFLPPLSMGMVRKVTRRRCYRCERELEPRDFPRDASKGSGFKSICKRCDNEKAKAYYAANRERQLAKANARNARLRAERTRRAGTGR